MRSTIAACALLLVVTTVISPRAASGDQQLSEWRRQLKDPDASVRKDAARLLSEARGENIVDMVPALADALADADWDATARAVANSAARRNRPRARGLSRFASRQKENIVAVEDDAYVIVNDADLTVAAEIMGDPDIEPATLTRFEADQKLAAYIAAHSEPDGDYRVVCASEVVVVEAV